MSALLLHHWRRHRVPLLALIGGLFVFEFLIVKIAPAPSEASAFQGIIALLPAPLLEMLGSELTANFNARGMIAFGFAHPFTLVMMSAWAARLTAGALAGEVGMGTMDLIAARPLPRRRQVFAALAALLLGLAGIIGSGWLGAAAGLTTRPELGIAPWDYLKVALGCFLLFAAFGSAGLAVSALKRQGGGAIGVISALIAVSFAWNFLARSWKPIAWSQRLSLFMYYRPEQLYRGIAWGDELVLLGVAVVAVAVALVAFERRDL